MAEINNNITYSSIPPNKNNSREKDDGSIIEAHYSSNMKVKRPKINPDSIQVNISQTPSLYSDSAANSRFQQLNTDIYESQKKEKSSHEFNFKTYFKIFVGIILTGAAIAGIRRIVRFFKR